MQMMMLCKEIFEHFGLGQILYLRPYRIVSTGNSTGIVQVRTHIHTYIHTSIRNGRISSSGAIEQHISGWTQENERIHQLKCILSKDLWCDAVYVCMYVCMYIFISTQHFEL